MEVINLEIKNFKDIYDYHEKLNAPFFYKVDYNTWLNSFSNDIDENKNKLFKKLYVNAIYENNEIIGYIQYGYTNLGFTDNGIIDKNRSYLIIRNFYFDKYKNDVGQKLLNYVLNLTKEELKIFAFFHYFGMSCYAGHGKLFEKYSYINDLLCRNNFIIEHENILYSTIININNLIDNEIEIKHSDNQPFNKNYITYDFLINSCKIGGCEIFYLNKEQAYLRWIYINDDLKGKGLGSKSLNVLKKLLYLKGISKLDTDTTINNIVAQHFYEKNKFINKGISRSYYFKR